MNRIFEKVKTGRKGRDKKWLIVRCIVYIALIVIMFSSADLYSKTTEAGRQIAWLRIVLVFLISVCGILIPWFFRPGRPEGFGKKWSAVLYILLVPAVLLLAMYMCEHIHGFNLFEIRKKFILFNGILFFGVYLIFHIFINRVKWSLMLTYILLVAASALNYYVNIFRGEAASAADIFCVGTALNVAGEYQFAVTPALFRCILVGALLLSFFNWLPKESEHLKGKRRLIYMPAAALIVVLIIWLFAVSDWPAKQGVKVRVAHPMKSYKKHGELLNFVRGFYYLLVSKPDGYSVSSCLDLMDSLGYESDEADADDGVKDPNIIIVMNESLTDFSVYDELELSEDPLPYIHSLAGKDNAVVGNLHVDVYGARTANTEYSVQTGNSMLFLPQNAVPYAMFVRRPQPALAWNLRDIGYSGIDAFHPHSGNGYSRPRAYPNLGFKRFIAVEDIKSELTPEDYLRNWVSDKTDFRYVTKFFEEAKSQSDAPYYLFNVTMQNHGSFSEDYDNFVQDIEINGEEFKNLKNIEDTKRFINLTQYSDEAFKELTDYFAGVDEPTMIVMFGDHKPGFDNALYLHLWGKRPSDLEREEQLQRYTTPLVIWANYDFNKDGKYNELFDDISVNYLSSEITSIAGLPMTAYQKFLVDMQKEIPVFTAHGFVDASGNYYSEEDKDIPFEEWIKNYNYLEYNYQFDQDSNRNESFFTLKTDQSELEKYRNEN